MELVSHLKRRKSCGHQTEAWDWQLALALICSGVKVLTAEMQAACTVTAYLSFRASRGSYSMPLLTQFVPTPAQIPIFLLFPSAPQLAGSRGKQSWGRSSLCPHSACASRTAGTCQQRCCAVKGQQVPPTFLAAGSLSTSSTWADAPSSGLSDMQSHHRWLHFPCSYLVYILNLTAELQNSPGPNISFIIALRLHHAGILSLL